MTKSFTRLPPFRADLEVVRFLLTRVPFAKVLWNVEGQEAVVQAFTALYGDSQVSYAHDVLAQQAIVTYLQAIVQMMTDFFGRQGCESANDILDHVMGVLDCQIDGKLILEKRLVRDLLWTSVHAALKILTSVPRRSVAKEYRRLLDFIRDHFPDSLGSQTVAMKSEAVAIVKAVTGALSKRGKASATRRVSLFVQKYPVENLVASMSESARVFKEGVGEPFLLHMLRGEHHGERARKRKGNAVAKASRKKCRNESLDSLPEFFSDAEDAIELSGESDDYPPHLFVSGDEESDEPMNGVVEGALARKRDIISAQDSSSEDDDVGENDEVDEAIGEGLDEVRSADYRDSDVEEESVDHVVRHAFTRATATRGKRNGTVRPRRKDDNAPCGTKDAESDSEGSGDEGGNANENNSAGLEGKRTVFRKLSQAARQLQESGPPDPLKEALQGARTARYRSRNAIRPLDELPEGARDVSPIPGSDNSVLRRKKVSTAVLEVSPSPKRGAKHVVEQFNNKNVRKGRFESHEDDWLLAGLQKYGWGAWVDISREFWNGNYTRAPLSLKDRARTMKLDEDSFPVKEIRKRRGPHRGKRRRKTANDSNSESIDYDEDEGDSDDN